MTTHISKYSVIEQLYAKIDSKLSKGLRESLSNFFILMLNFQVHVIKYFDPDQKGSRTVKGMNTITADKNKKELQTIQEAKERVNAKIMLVDAEVTKFGIDNLKEGQKSQQEQLKILSRDLGGDFLEAESHQQKRHKDLIEMWKGSLDELKKNSEKERDKVEKNYLSRVRT